MISVVVPAHNEAAVLPRLLTALEPGVAAGDLHVVVVPNGCVDDTAQIARRGAATAVVELADGDKIGALNAGDRAANGFPRFYVDGDIVVRAEDLVAMADLLASDGVEAVAPALEIDDRQSSALVRSYQRYWAALPSVRSSLVGRGCFGVTEAGRARWSEFPGVVADDQFVNQMFDPRERVVAEGVVSVVTAPADLRALVGRKRRSHRGNVDLARDGLTDATSRVGWIDVCRRQPRRVVDLPAFLFVTIAVRTAAWIDARRGTVSWGSDRTSRDS